MPAQLNHTIVWSSDKTKSARFLAELPAALEGLVSFKPLDAAATSAPAAV